MSDKTVRSDGQDEAALLAARMTRGMMMGPAKYAHILVLLNHLKRTAPAEFEALSGVNDARW